MWNIFAILVVNFLLFSLSTSQESGKINFGAAPDLNDEESSSFHMPERLKCDGCKIIAHMLFEAFRAEERKVAKDKLLSESQIIDAAENVCVSNFEGYGITDFAGERRLKGPGLELENVPGVTQSGGKWPVRLQDLCHSYIGELGEDYFYRKYRRTLDNSGSSKPFQKALCEEGADNSPCHQSYQVPSGEKQLQNQGRFVVCHSRIRHSIMLERNILNPESAVDEAGDTVGNSTVTARTETDEQKESRLQEQRQFWAIFDALGPERARKKCTRPLVGKAQAAYERFLPGTTACHIANLKLATKREELSLGLYALKALLDAGGYLKKPNGKQKLEEENAAAPVSPVSTGSSSDRSVSVKCSDNEDLEESKGARVLDPECTGSETCSSDESPHPAAKLLAPYESESGTEESSDDE